MSFALRGLLAIVSCLVVATTAAAGKARVGTWGFDAAGMDRKIAPGDDFFRYANGTWAKTLKIPADRPYYGVWDILDEEALTNVREILERAGAGAAKPGTIERKVGDYYASFMDEAAVEAKGLSPVQPDLDRIAALTDKTALARALAEAQTGGVDTPFSVSVQPDAKAPTQYLVYIQQSGLGLPDRDYYLKDDPKLADTRAKYVTHIAAMFRLAGLPDADTRAQAVFALEHKIAEGQWTRVELRDDEKNYNPWARADFQTRAPGLDWNAFFDAAGVAGQPVINADQPTALQAEAKLVDSEPLAVWKDYLILRTLEAAAPFLSKAVVAEFFAFNQGVLQGTPVLAERWKRGVRLSKAVLGEGIGEVYVARFFPPQAKAQADLLVHNLITALGARLDRSDWMSAQTKAKARAKLAKLLPMIGYPDKWRDYSALQVVRGDAYGNAMRAEQFEYRRNLAKLGKPVDRGEWLMTPMTINAYYDPSKNVIVFPAAVLQPPFFDPKADPAVNYGAIGAIIGHEISHGYDDQGRKWTGDGKLDDWWTKEDGAKYQTRADRISAEYDAYEPIPGMHVNGKLTLGEDIADISGLTIAHDAYHAALHGHRAPVIDGFSGEQRFFLGFAQAWRSLYREEVMRELLTTDPHAPDEDRAQAVRNLDAWYAAFNVKPNQKLYLKPADRARIW